MIEGLYNLLNKERQPGIRELSALLQKLFGGTSVKAKLMNEEKLLRSRVFRLTFEIGSDTRSFVVKRFSLERAYREQLLIRRWLPAVGLGKYGPPLLGVAAEHSSQCIWHVYEDLGDCTLDHNEIGYLMIRKAVDLISEVHARFAATAPRIDCEL